MGTVRYIGGQLSRASLLGIHKLVRQRVHRLAFALAALCLVLVCVQLSARLPSTLVQRQAPQSKPFAIDAHISCTAERKAQHTLDGSVAQAHDQHHIVGWLPRGPISLTYDCANELRLTLHLQDDTLKHFRYSHVADADTPMHIAISYNAQLDIVRMHLNGVQQRAYYVASAAPLQDWRYSKLKVDDTSNEPRITIYGVRVWDTVLTSEQISFLHGTPEHLQDLACYQSTSPDADIASVDRQNYQRSACCLRPRVQIGSALPGLPCSPIAPPPAGSTRLHNTSRSQNTDLAVTTRSPARLSHELPSGHSYMDATIPCRIHQTYKQALLPDADGGDFGSLLRFAQTWQKQNPECVYQLWGDDMVDQFVRTKHPQFYPIFLALPKPVLKADLFRYMVVYDEGGVYADVDTEALRPMEYWTQPHHRLIWSRSRQLFLSEVAYLAELASQQAAAADSEQVTLPPINVIIGVEADFTGMPTEYTRRGYATEHQLCQWTFASVAEHPMLAHVIQNVMQQLSTRTPSELLDADVLEVTGPGIWTTSIRDYLIQVEGLPAADALMGYVTALQVGDIYILPVNGFGDTPRFRMAGADRANDAGLSPRCVEHQFAGSWKEDDDSWQAVRARADKQTKLRAEFHRQVMSHASVLS